MTGTTELREAARHLRANPNPAPCCNDALAAWLIEEADTLDLLSIEPTTSLEVARHILKAAA